MIKFAKILILGLLTLALMVTISCTDTEKEEPVKENVEEGTVIMRVSGMPVYQHELDELYDQLDIPDEYLHRMAIQMHFLIQTRVEKVYKKELAELKEEGEDILKQIKDGNITFEDAILKYSEAPGKEETNGLTEGYYPGMSFYAMDGTLKSMKEGDISDVVITPVGVSIYKVEKLNKSLKDELVSLNFKEIALSLNRFMPEGEDINMKAQGLAMESELEWKDLSFVSEELYCMRAKDQEDFDKLKEEFSKIELPETKWTDQPDDHVLAVINDYDVTKGEMLKVAEGVRPSKAMIYSRMIPAAFIEPNKKIGYYKEHHEDIFKRLNEIKADVEAGNMTFEEAQIEFSEDPGIEQTTIYEGIGRGQFVPAFEKSMFSIDVGVISEPFLSQFGGHILMIDGFEEDEEGERTTVDVRHILINFESYLDKENPNASYQANIKIRQSNDIEVLDEYLKSMLPELGNPPKQAAPEIKVESEEEVSKDEGETKPVEE